MTEKREGRKTTGNASRAKPPTALAAGSAVSSSRPKAGMSALDSAVSKLVRAALGAGETDHVADEDLDKYVAELVLKEARQKSKLFQDVGTRAYLPHTGLPPCKLPKVNKGFLFNVVKRTDDHNRVLLRHARDATNDRLQDRPPDSIERAELEKYKGCGFSEKEWKCTLCRNINRARRTQCDRCQTGKSGTESAKGARQGRGGQLMEREVVEYRRRNEDDKYHEFERLTKKRKKQLGDGEDDCRGRGAAEAEPPGSQTSEASHCRRKMARHSNSEEAGSRGLPRAQ